EAHHVAALLPEPLDAEAHHVAGLEEFRRLLAEPDARGRARGNHVTGLQHHELRHVGHDVADVENHGAGRSRLHALAIDVEPHRQRLRCRNLVRGDEPRTERAKRLAAFPLGPLPGALELELALGDVVGDAIAGHVIQRFLFRYITRARAYHDGELDLPIG